MHDVGEHVGRVRQHDDEDADAGPPPPCAGAGGGTEQRPSWRGPSTYTVFLSAIGAEVLLHAVVAVGVLVGRYGRWNSWDLGLRPFAVLTDTLGYANLRGVAAVVLFAAGIAVITVMLRLAAYGVVDIVRSDA